MLKILLSVVIKFQNSKTGWTGKGDSLKEYKPTLPFSSYLLAEIKKDSFF